MEVLVINNRTEITEVSYPLMGIEYKNIGKWMQEIRTLVNDRKVDFIINQVSNVAYTAKYINGSLVSNITGIPEKIDIIDTIVEIYLTEDISTNTELRNGHLVVGWVGINKDTKEKEAKYLKSQGFEVLPYKVFNTNNVTISNLFNPFSKDVVEYAITLNDNNPITNLYDDKIKYSLCFGESKITKAKEVTVLHSEVFVGLNGSYVETLYFDPVIINGKTISSIPALNKVVNPLTIGKNSKLLIGLNKSNLLTILDVTDHIKKEQPKVCRYCGNKLKKTRHSFRCTNKKCKLRLVTKIYVMAKALGFDKFTKEFIYKLVIGGVLTEYSDLFKIPDFMFYTSTDDLLDNLDDIEDYNKFVQNKNDIAEGQILKGLGVIKLDLIKIYPWVLPHFLYSGFLPYCINDTKQKLLRERLLEDYMEIRNLLDTIRNKDD